MADYLFSSYGEPSVQATVLVLDKKLDLSEKEILDQIIFTLAPVLPLL